MLSRTATRKLIAVVVTGTREGRDPELIANAVSAWARADVSLVIHGNAPGVDTQVQLECGRLWNLPTLPMPAQWALLHNAAGPARNKHMVNVAVALRECGWQVRGAAFPGPNSRGTWQCKNLLEVENFAVDIY